MKMENAGFIGVHVGAGKYSNKSAPLYEKLCRVACKRATEMLNSGKSALEAVTIATAILEDSSLTNAGYGSNLTIDGQVECDASIMDGSNLSFGAVGAVSGVKNPICLAKKICYNQNEQLTLGRIPPCVIVGAGAFELAQKYADVVTVFPESLITGNALKLHQKFKTQLADYEQHENLLHYDRLDTVGAVSVDKQGRTAAACSSGGILLKQPGRIGQAAMYGCGCWAQDRILEEESSVAVTTSGCGEHIMKTTLAREVANKVRVSNGITCVTLHENIDDLFLNSRMLKNVDEKLCGMLLLKNNDEECEFLWAHTTPSLCIGYMDTITNKAKSRVSKLPCDSQVGKTVVVEGVSAFSSSS